MIEIRGVTKYFDKIKALDDVDINIKDGSIYGLVGTNGAGKTTIIKNIMGIQKPEEGTISISGQPVYENPEVKKKLGYVSDDMFFFHGYSLQDMRNFYKGLYEDWNDERFQVLVKDFGLHMKRKISTFSKGMQKQAAIILALSIMPDYLILDEPIDGLDPIMRLKAWKHIIDDVADRNTSVLVSSHNLREMEGYCDYIGIISDGKMVMERDLEDLKTDVHKVQVAFTEGAKKDFSELNILHIESRGSVDLLIVRNKREKIEEIIGKENPAVFDVLPLTLEEIFIYELGGENDEIKEIIK